MPLRLLIDLYQPWRFVTVDIYSHVKRLLNSATVFESSVRVIWTQITVFVSHLLGVAGVGVHQVHHEADVAVDGGCGLGGVQQLLQPRGRRVAAVREHVEGGGVEQREQLLVATRLLRQALQGPVGGQAPDKIF